MPRKKQNSKRRHQNSYKSHFLSSLSYIAPHSHTGKVAAHKHTSHGALFILLIIVGILLFANLAVLRTDALTAGGSNSINAIVYGAAPTKGAALTTPVTKTTYKTKIIDLKGTCEDQTAVVIYRNATFAGSTACLNSSFALDIQLEPGLNTLQALNYDGANQAGPLTDQVQVTYDTPMTTQAQNTQTSYPLITPLEPTPAPTVAPCFNGIESQGLSLQVACITRNVTDNQNVRLPVVITGGIAPYTLSVDWGDGSSVEYVKVEQAGEVVLTHTFKLNTVSVKDARSLANIDLQSLVRKIRFEIEDSKGSTAQIQTVVLMNHDQTAVANTAGTAAPLSPSEDFMKNFEEIWLKASAPLYWSLLALFAGFWFGDIFQRYNSMKHTRRRKH